MTLTCRPQTCSLVTLFQRYVSTKLEVSIAFMLRENRKHKKDGQTDRRTGVQHLMLPSGEHREEVSDCTSAGKRWVFYRVVTATDIDVTSCQRQNEHRTR